MATHTITGTHIRYTLDNLGLLGSPGDVNAGDEGVVIGPASEPGWILTEPAKHPRAICPVTAEMIEAVE